MYLLVPEIYSPISYESIPYFIGVVFLTTFIVPLLSVLFLLITKRISSMEITKMEERSLPFLSIGAFYAVTCYMFYSRMQVPRPLLVMMIAVTLLIFLIYVISLKMKISVHSAAMWGMAGIFSALAMRYLSTDFIVPLALIFLAAGVTTTSRLFLERHTPAESWSGVCLGFVLCFSAVYLFG